mmetsp:Transcript_3390/g.8068  ORF Transcript_3390/g.8068 Transcript_3390/m.8068 type:complete len:284 (+) Transcript_3390:591-1442(+)
MTAGHESVLGQEYHSSMREPAAAHSLHCLLGGHGSGGRGQEVHARVLCGVGKDVGGRGEGHVLHPRVGVDHADLRSHLLEAHVRTEDLRRLRIHSLHSCSEEAHSPVARSSSQNNVGAVPGDSKDSRLEALHKLAHPPVALLLVMANSYALLPARHRKFLFVVAPLCIGCSAVYPQQHQCWLPGSIAVPHVRISILRASEDSVGVRRPVNGRDSLVVLGQHVHHIKCPVLELSQMNLIVVGREGNHAAVLVHRKTGDSQRALGGIIQLQNVITCRPVRGLCSP